MRKKITEKFFRIHSFLNRRTILLTHLLVKNSVSAMPKLPLAVINQGWQKQEPPSHIEADTKAHDQIQGPPTFPSINPENASFPLGVNNPPPPQPQGKQPSGKAIQYLECATKHAVDSSTKI